MPTLSDTTRTNARALLRGVQRPGAIRLAAHVAAAWTRVGSGEARLADHLFIYPAYASGAPPHRVAQAGRALVELLDGPEVPADVVEILEQARTGSQPDTSDRPEGEPRRRGEGAGDDGEREDEDESPEDDEDLPDLVDLEDEESDGYLYRILINRILCVRETSDGSDSDEISWQVTGASRWVHRGREYFSFTATEHEDIDARDVMSPSTRLQSGADGELAIPLAEAVLARRSTEVHQDGWFPKHKFVYVDFEISLLEVDSSKALEKIIELTGELLALGVSLAGTLTSIKLFTGALKGVDQDDIDKAKKLLTKLVELFESDNPQHLGTCNANIQRRHLEGGLTWVKEPTRGVEYSLIPGIYHSFLGDDGSYRVNYRVERIPLP